MSQIVVLGEAATVRGFALAGATVLGAESADAVRAAWQALPSEVAVVALTPAAAAALDDLGGTEGPLRVVMPG